MSKTSSYHFLIVIELPAGPIHEDLRHSQTYFQPLLYFYLFSFTSGDVIN